MHIVVIADHAYVIAEGRIFTEGLPDVLATMPEIRRAYLDLLGFIPGLGKHLPLFERTDAKGGHETRRIRMGQ